MKGKTMTGKINPQTQYVGQRKLVVQNLGVLR